MRESVDFGNVVEDGPLEYHQRPASPVSIDERRKRPSTKRSQDGFLWSWIRPGERGQAMAEIALVLPLFLLFVFAIIEIGRAWGAKQGLTSAAREGARILILPYGAGFTYASESDAQDAALKAVRDTLNSSGVPSSLAQITLIRITPGDDGVFNTSDDRIEKNYSDGKRGDRVGIQILYPFESYAPLLLKMFENGGAGGGAQSVINMGVSCYMDHE